MNKLRALLVTLVLAHPSLVFANTINQPLHLLKRTSDFELSGPVSELWLSAGEVLPIRAKFNEHGFLTYLRYDESKGEIQNVGYLQNTKCNFSGPTLESCFWGELGIHEDVNNAKTRIEVLENRNGEVKLVTETRLLGQSSLITRSNVTLYSFVYAGQRYKQTLVSAGGVGYSLLYEYSNGRLDTVLKVKGGDSDGETAFEVAESYQYEDNLLVKAIEYQSRILIQYNENGARSYLKTENSLTGQVGEEFVYSNYEYDSCGNWISRTENHTIHGDKPTQPYRLMDGTVTDEIPAGSFPVELSRKVQRTISYHSDCTSNTASF